MPSSVPNRSSSGNVGDLTSFREGWALTSDAARWARSTIWSRAFTIHRIKTQQGKNVTREDRPPIIRNNTPVIALVPVLDMIDHDPDVEAVWHTGPEGIQDFQFNPISSFSKVIRLGFNK